MSRYLVLLILLFKYLLILKELNVSFDFLAKQDYRKKVRYCHKAVEQVGYVPYDCRLNHCSHESGNNENCKIYAYPLLCEKVNETASAVYPSACNGCYRKDECCDTEECTGKVTESVLECYQRHIKTNA